MQKNTYCTFYLIRHGQTDMNEAGLLQGQSNSILTAKGKEQAKVIAKELKSIHFDIIFSSDLTRAKDTADIIAEENNVIVKTTKLLRERSWGQLEGKTRDVLEQFNDIYHALTNEQKFTYKNYKDVESDEELTNRFITFIREVAIVYPEKKILLVSHGSAIGSFLVRIGYWSYNNVLPKIPHTAYIKFKSDGIEFFIEKTQGFEGIIPRELRNSDR